MTGKVTLALGAAALVLLGYLLWPASRSKQRLPSAPSTASQPTMPSRPVPPAPTAGASHSVSATSDFPSRLAALEADRDNPKQAVLIKALLTEWFAQDRNAAIAYVLHRVAADDTLAVLLLKPIVALVSDNGANLGAIETLLGSLPPTKAIYAAVTESFARHALRDPRSAAAFVTRVNEPEVRRAYAEIVGAILARTQGAAALTNGTLDDSTLPPEIVTGLLSQLLKTAPDAAKQWLDSRPRDSAYDVVRYRLSIALAADDPGAALKLTALITDEKLQSEATLPALQSLARRDYSAAIEWATASNLPVESLAPALANGSDGATTDYLGALERVSAAPDGRSAIRSQLILFSAWARRDPQQAEVWLSRSRLDDTTKQMFRQQLPSAPRP